MSTRPDTRRQRGIAIVIVLGTVALFFVVSIMCMIIGKTTRISGKVQVERDRARYACESSLSYIEWMIVCDRAYRPFSRSLGQLTLGSDESQVANSIWAADGHQYDLDLDRELNVKFRILDANRGWNISGQRPSPMLRRQFGAVDNESGAETRDIDVFLDCLDDYVDPDDLTQLHGLEEPDYDREGYERFPRNAPLQFAEEAYWLPHITALVPQFEDMGDDQPMPEDLLRIIPPPGRQFPGKPAFFSSTPEMIEAFAGLTSDELVIALDARQQWLDSGVPIRDSLGPLYSRIASAMSFDESGIYTIDITTSVGNGRVKRRVLTTLDLGRLPNGSGRLYLSNWQQLYY